MGFIRKYRVEIIYLSLLLLVIVNQNSEENFIYTRIMTIGVLSLLSYFLKNNFKFMNTLLLSVTINLVTYRSFRIDGYDVNFWSVSIALLLYLALIGNIFMVFKDMYLLKTNEKGKRNGLKLLYVFTSFLLLVGTVISSYSHIYQGIWLNYSGSFSVVDSSVFPSFYYSSVVYFTLGFGEITPLTDLARSVTITQMFLGYLITCLIVPTFLVAFQRVFTRE
jgi:hypothetical protein